MGESWFQRELLTPRRLIFNILFYGSHIFWFAYGWHSQVSRIGHNPRSPTPITNMFPHTIGY